MDDLDTALWFQDLEHASQESIRKWRACERLSLSDILLYCDPSTSFKWRKQINLEIGIAQMCEVCFCFFIIIYSLTIIIDYYHH